MNKYYQNELDALRELAADFSKANPTLAPQLSATSADPDVERILEGVAFLTAGIRQKIDDDFPEFAQGLLRQIFPHYLRPMPSSTIIEFTPKPILKSKLQVPAGTYIDSEQVDGVSCRFKTSYDLEVWPLHITQAKVGETPTGRQALTLGFQLDGINLAAWESDSIRLHLSGDFHSAADLFYILLNSVEQIDLVTAATTISSSDIKIRPIGFEPQDALLDYPGNSFPSYRLLQEYFLLKEKFLFIDISGLRRYTQSLSGNSFELQFYIGDSPVRIPRVSTSRFILHATPAINLFEHDAESLLNDHKRSEYKIRPLRDSGNRYHIFSVDSVVGQNRRSAQRTSYREIGMTDPGTGAEPVYSIHHKQGGVQGASDVYLNFSYPADSELEEQETLLIKLTCSNGEIPTRLRVGDISKPTSSTSELVEFSNILQPCESQFISADSSILWRLLSHLSLNYLSLADTENLRSLLSLYAYESATGNKQAIANRKRIEGISKVTVTACDRLLQGIPIRGQAINVQVNPSAFASRGDMYLFGMLLDYLFASFANFNSFTEFSMTDEASDESYTWKPRSGDRPLV